MDRNELLKMLTVTLDIGAGLLRCGGEVHRVEDTVLRISRAYGAVRCDVFVITSGINVTWHLEDGSTITETRRVVEDSLDLTQVEEYNSLSRHICYCRPDADTCRKLLDQLESSVEPRLRRYRYFYPLGHMLGAGAFAVFFGGCLEDSLPSALAGLSIYFMSPIAQKLFKSSLVQTLVLSFLSAMVCVGCYCLGLGVNLDKIMIGAVMLLVPGVACTTAIRDMMEGDTISGMLRLCNGLLQAGALACGFVLALQIWGGVR